jgi:carboxypeptidase Taq
MEVKQTKTPYEALIDQFEPQMTTQKITETFNQLQTGLRHILDKLQDANKKSTIILCQAVPVETQKQISQLITQTLGYDTVSSTTNGRIDETEHPFTSGSYPDVRITTHYYVNDYTNFIFFYVLHEAGHALYELNVNPKWRYQPVGNTCAYGIHESQSRFYENIIGRSKEFWTSFLPKVQILLQFFQIYS